MLWRTVAPLLREAGYILVMPEVGELVTSLDMAGVSLTVTWLDEELEEYWTAPAITPAYRRGTVDSFRPGTVAEAAEDVAESDAGYDAGEASRSYAKLIVEGLTAAARELRRAEHELGALDAIAGDGDHGRGMVRGSSAAELAAAEAFEQGAGAGSVLVAAGEAWADKAGGTSGVLWGAGLQSFGERIGDREFPSPDVLAGAVRAFADRVAGLGKAEPGDKTMVDSLLPFTESLTASLAAGEPLADAWAAAAGNAGAAAQATASLRPQKGRARPLAEKSVGTPDPGATSLAMVFDVVGPYLTAEREAAFTA